MTIQIRHNIGTHKLGSSFKELTLIKIQKKRYAKQEKQ